MSIFCPSPRVLAVAFAALAAAACASTPAPETASTPAAPSAPARAAPAPAAVAATPPAAFGICAACHGTTASAPPGVGPNLHGVFGRKAGAAAGYDYSDAMKNSKIVWNAETLTAFVHDAEKTIPGNNMDYPGVADAATVKAIVDYMAALK